MIAYLIRRILYAIPILIGVNLLTFALFFVVNTPDDMARMQLGMKRVTPEAIDKWKQQRGYELNAANAMFVGKDIPWRKEFLDLTRTHYGSSIFTVDYGKPEAARQSINAWVEGQTRKRIANILSPGSLNADQLVFGVGGRGGGKPSERQGEHDDKPQRSSSKAIGGV